MKLTTITHVPVDGVMQEVDRGANCEGGGWAMPLFDDEAATLRST